MSVMIAVALLSCSKEGTPDADPTVEFGVVADGHVPTRVTDAADGTSSFDSNDIINVLGFLVNDRDAADVPGETDYGMPYIGKYSSSTITPLSFPYSSVTATGENGGKVYPSGYYWPKFDHCAYEALHFFGYYALNTGTAGPEIQYNADAAPSFIYTSSSSITGNQKEDFLVADVTATKNDVELHFRHPLVKVVLEVKLADWITSADVNWMFPDFVLKDEYIHIGESWAWKVSEQTTGLKEVRTTGNVVSFFAIPQKITQFAIVWNYHKELVTLPEGGLDMKAGERHTISLTIKDNKVVSVGVVRDSGASQQWEVFENTNELK